MLKEPDARGKSLFERSYGRHYSGVLRQFADRLAMWDQKAE